MKFDIITLFPEVVEPYLKSSIIGRAEKKKLIKTKVWDLRSFTKDKHRKVDDRPFGGGPGMVLYAEPVARAVKAATRGTRGKKKVAVIIFEAGGKQFNEKLAQDFTKKYKHIVMVAGHYEGVDARAKKIIKDAGLKVLEISIGPYVLTGGELPALVVIDTLSRKIPGVLGKSESLEEARHGVGVPSYTRPEVIKIGLPGQGGKKYTVPKVLMSGHHAKIEEWRRKHKS